MSVVNKEYAFGVNKFNKPKTFDQNDAIGARLMELIMMEPGDDPLHPDMGVGIKSFRYTINTIDALRDRIENQIATYLPFYQNVNVVLVLTPDKLYNIEIVIGDTKFIYDSSASSKPISLEDIQA